MTDPGGPSSDNTSSKTNTDSNVLHLKIKVKETTKDVIISTEEKPVSTSTRPYSLYTIYNLKEAYFATELQNNKRIRILYAGKELRDEFFVKDCNLHDNAVLHAVITQHQSNSHHSNAFQNNSIRGGTSSHQNRNEDNQNQSIFGLRRLRRNNPVLNNGNSNNGRGFNGNNSGNSQQRRVEGYIFFFLSFIGLFIIWWARYMYPAFFSKMAINILGIFSGIYFISLLHFIL